MSAKYPGELCDNETGIEHYTATNQEHQKLLPYVPNTWPGFKDSLLSKYLGILQLGSIHDE